MCLSGWSPNFATKLRVEKSPKPTMGQADCILEWG